LLSPSSSSDKIRNVEYINSFKEQIVNTKSARILILGLVVALALAACGGGGGSSSVDVTLKVDNTFAYAPNTITAKVGQTVNITIDNSGALEHTFLIDELSVNSGPIAAGTKQTVTFTPSKAGTFTFYCNTPGHKEGGMTGTITVNP
jgi:plastocyanin